MNKYVKQAKDFLESCNATLTITYLGKEANASWDETSLRNTYRATIKTPKGSMWVKFWDSIAHVKSGEHPNEYDILACLQKYDVGTIDDFVSEYGYEVNEWSDVKKIQKIYRSVVNEYKKVKRCFTDEQIEAMCEIQ